MAMGTVTRTAVVTILSRRSISFSASLIIARSRKAEQQMSASGQSRNLLYPSGTAASPSLTDICASSVVCRKIAAWTAALPNFAEEEF
jgi:hypothetical protein